MEARTDKEFDDLLRKRYEDHTIEPEKSLWEGIDTRLYQKKIDRNIHKVRQLKIAISAVAAIFAGVIVYSMIRAKDNKPETQIISEIPVKPAPAENENLLKSGLNNKINNEKSEYSDKTEQEKFNPKSKEKKTGLIKETLASSAQFISPVTDSSYNKTALLTSSEFHDTLSIKNRYIQPVTGIILPAHLQARSVKIVELAPSVLPGQIRSGLNKSDDTKETALNSIRRVPEKSNQPELILPEVYRSPDQPGGLITAKNSQRHTHFFVEGYVSPEISYRVLSVNSKYSMPDYGKSYFNKAERPDFTFSAGISGGLRITDKLILKSGAYYSRYSYKLKTEAFNLINTGSDGYLAYTSSGPVNITLISSDSLSTKSLVKSSLNFSYLNVPLIAEIHFRNNYFLDLGLNLNMLAGQNMNWQAENFDGNFSETAADPIDGLEFGSLSLTVGLGKEKYITRQLSIIVNPSVRINLTSLNNTAPVKSYPYSWGLNAGLRYYFD
jgi:hypothetical protein